MTRSTAGRTFAIAIFIATVATNVILEIGFINLSYAQVAPTPNSICEPNDKHVNATESRECGIPKTPSVSSSSANSRTSTTGITTPPLPLQNTTTSQGAIPGLIP
jgi:hypothetical protein